MEDLAASIMSLSHRRHRRHSAPLYLFFDVPAFPKHHDEHDGEFEFAAAGAKNVVDDDDDDYSSGAAPRECTSDVSAYSDELFRGGVLLPLKLPPRLQHPAATWSAASSAATSPTALGRVQSCSPFATSRRHRGFDPFAEALEKVRRDGAAPRRARSLSPLRLRSAAAAAATTSLNSSGTAAAAQKASARTTWRRRRGVRRVKHFFCRAVMASAASAPKRTLRPRRRGDDGAPCRSGLLVCFGF